MRVEVIGFFRDFLELGLFEKRLNANFLVLIFKGGVMEDIKDFLSVAN